MGQTADVWNKLKKVQIMCASRNLGGRGLDDRLDELYSVNILELPVLKALKGDVVRPGALLVVVRVHELRTSVVGWW